MSIWGDLKFRIDPWDAEYGASAVFEGFDAEVADNVDLDVEVPAGGWTALEPGETCGYDRLVFVDGVRRIEARVVALHDGQIVHGLLGSYGAGAVALHDGRAALVASHIERVVVTGAGIAVPQVLQIRDDLTFRPMACESRDAQAPLVVLQKQMRAAEARIAESFTADDTLVVADGPLVFDYPVEGLVGFVKRIFDPYLPSEKSSLLASLGPGQRTPIFALTSDSRYARYAWFLRLAHGGPGQSPFAGIVRLELAETIGLEQARRVADETTALLPRLASSRTFDPRAPQNLIPVGGLEKQLKHLLGDARLIRRHIETAIAQDAARD